MNLQVVGRGCAVTPELRQRAERKLQKLERRLGDKGSAEVTLSSERNPSIASGQIAEVRVQLGADTLHVRESASSIEAALDLAADRILRAVTRHREQKSRHRPHHYPEPTAALHGDAGDEGDEGDEEADAESA